MNKELVLFDLDYTLLRLNSQKELASFLFDRKQIGVLFFLKILFWFILYKLGVAKNPAAFIKRIYLGLRGVRVDNFAVILTHFFNDRLKSSIYKDAIAEIDFHRSVGRDVVIISTSLQPLVSIVGDYLGLNTTAFGTELEVVAGLYTGAVTKVLTVEEKIEICYTLKRGKDLRGTYFYNDHIADLKLLDLVEFPIVVNPNLAMRKIALARGWEIKYFYK
ncbi:HAD-IB family hydrolase [Patescibacteria group bacterium]|nr:HAD-IB family hydrolase [Patescibacteria group bacterium]